MNVCFNWSRKRRNGGKTDWVLGSSSIMRVVLRFDTWRRRDIAACPIVGREHGTTMHFNQRETGGRDVLQWNYIKNNGNRYTTINFHCDMHYDSEVGEGCNGGRQVQVHVQLWIMIKCLMHTCYKYKRRLRRLTVIVEFLSNVNEWRQLGKWLWS